MTVSMQGLVADPELAAIQRRREMLMGILRSNNQNQNYTSAVSPLGPVANALAAALIDYKGGEEERGLATRRREEDRQWARDNPNPLAAAIGLNPARPSATSPPAPSAPAGGQGGEALRSHFEEASRATGIPVAVLMAQAQQESNFNPNARGRAGEIGVMQIMPSTARQPGYGMAGVDPATLTDPRANIMFGAQYQAARAGQGVNWNDPAQRARAWTAYNGGGDPNYAANVERFMPAGGQQASPVQPPGGLTQANAQSAAVQLMQQAEAAERSSNPEIRRRADGLRAQAQMAMALARQETSMPPTVQMDGPQGPGVYERGPNGVRRIGGIPTPERAPSDREAAQARYIRLSLAGRSRQLTDEEQAQLALDAGTLEGQPQVIAGPSGIGFVAPRPLPLGGGSQGAPAAPGQPPATIPVQATPPGADAVPGAQSPTQRAPQQVQIPGGRTAQFIPAEQPPAQPPQAVAGGMLTNVNNLRQAQTALRLATERPASFGAWQGITNMVPGALERVDPDGVEARAMVANLGSMVIHDRSGAAVTAAEFPRLRPFIPAVGDPPNVVRTKLQQFVREYESILRDQYEAFGPASGYRPLTPVEEILRGSQIPGPGGGTAEPPGTQVIEFDRNGRRVRR